MRMGNADVITIGTAVGVIALTYQRGKLLMVIPTPEKLWFPWASLCLYIVAILLLTFGRPGAADAPLSSRRLGLTRLRWWMLAVLLAVFAARLVVTIKLHLL